MSHEIAYYSLATPGAQRADWFGMINSVFPGVMDVWADEEDAAAYRPPLPEGLASHLLPDVGDSDDEGPYWNPDVADLYNVYRNAMDFSLQRWDNIQMARAAESSHDAEFWPELDYSPVTYNLLFSCNPSTFTKTSDNKWWDSETQQLYTIVADVICDYDTKTLLALRPQPFGFLVILCPAVLTQRVGEPKMWADLAGNELSNTRPSAELHGSSTVTEAESLDLLSWAGMTIDQLRERVLSVYMGRVILFLTGQRNYKTVIVRAMEGYRSFDECKTLPLGNAVYNLDSLSIYSTGARFYHNEVVTSVHLSDNDPSSFGWRTQNTHRWDTRGMLYNNNLPKICVTLPEEERDTCEIEVDELLEDLSELEEDDPLWIYAITDQLAPYFTDEGGEWIQTGEWEWSVTPEEIETYKRRRRRRSERPMMRKRGKV